MDASRHWTPLAWSHFVCDSAQSGKLCWSAECIANSIENSVQVQAEEGWIIQISESTDYGVPCPILGNEDARQKERKPGTWGEGEVGCEVVDR